MMDINKHAGITLVNNTRIQTNNVVLLNLTLNMLS